MAGWHWRMEVETLIEDGAELVRRAADVSRDFEERVVRLLTWPEHHGNSAAEWESFDVTPAQAGFTPDHPFVETKAGSLETAVAGLSRWQGIAIGYDIPPHALEPTPTIYGVCTWRVWFLDAWNVDAAIDYPMRSDCPSAAWVSAFKERVARAFVISDQ